MSYLQDRKADIRARQEEAFYEEHGTRTTVKQVIVLRGSDGEIHYYVVECTPSSWTDVLEEKHGIRLAGTPRYARAYLKDCDAKQPTMVVHGNDQELEKFARTDSRVFCILDR